MPADSRILIDEVVMPNAGAHVWPAGLDLQLYIMHGAMERNVDQWHALLDQAGLKAVEIKTYAPVMRSSIIYALPK
jgi:hypothetical protein